MTVRLDPVDLVDVIRKFKKALKFEGRRIKMQLTSRQKKRQWRSEFFVELAFKMLCYIYKNTHSTTLLFLLFYRLVIIR